MARILVSGGAGYIGSHTLRHLLRAGHEPVVVDDLSAGHRAAVPDSVPIIEANICDAAVVAKALSDHRPDAVVHFAGSIEAGESMTDPRRFYANNVAAGLALLDALVDGAASGPPVPVVFSSSAAVYGDPAYGAGAGLDTLERADAEIICKVQPPNAPAGRFPKDAFTIDLQAGTVTCPAGQTTPLRAIKNGHIAHFRHACRSCPLQTGAPVHPMAARSMSGTTSNNFSVLAPGRPARHEGRLHRDARCRVTRRRVDGQYRLNPGWAGSWAAVKVSERDVSTLPAAQRISAARSRRWLLLRVPMVLRGLPWLQCCW